MLVDATRRDLERFVHRDDWIVIPDIHGSPLIQNVVDVVASLPAKIVQLGDIIDARQPGCSGEVALGAVSCLVAARPDTILIRGNHEQEFIRRCGVDAGVGQESTNSISEPGDGTNAAHSDYNQTYDELIARYGHIPPQWLRLIRSSIYYHETDHLLFLHGGYSSKVETSAIQRIAMTDMLTSYCVRPSWHGKKIVRGHRLVDEPEEWINHISCDAGGWLPGRPFRIAIVSDSAADQKLRGWIEVTKSTLKLWRMT